MAGRMKEENPQEYKKKHKRTKTRPALRSHPNNNNKKLEKVVQFSKRQQEQVLAGAPAPPVNNR
jgi:hypothetical protein